MVDGGGVAPLGVGIDALQLTVEGVELSDAEIAHSSYLTGKEQQPDPVDAGIGEFVLCHGYGSAWQQPRQELADAIVAGRQSAQISVEEWINRQRAECPQALQLIRQTVGEVQAVTEVEHGAGAYVCYEESLRLVGLVTLYDEAGEPEEAHREGQEAERYVEYMLHSHIV